MKYDLDRNASAELTRLVLFRMSQHEAVFTPVSFAVWYEHLAGINLRLSHAIDVLLEEKAPLNDQAIQKLYEQFVSESNTEAQGLIRDNAQVILNEIKRYAENADHKANEYGGHLERSAGLMTEQTASPALKAVVEGLRIETTSMQVAVRDLSQNLEQSQQKIEELRLQLDRARTEAVTDPLTGLLNRRGFELRLMEAFESTNANGKQTSLIMIDIDHFKKVNDTYGHLFGDKVIRALAEMLKANVNNKGTVARLGGEEFGILLPDSGIEDAHTLAEKIRQMMERGKIRRIDKNDHIEGITISLGVAKLLSDDDHTTFIDRADKALYVSKANGRNQVTLSQQ
jgi:diguanylate cyclase